MELKLVEQLLEKYFQGATTIAEEKQLKAYFSSNDVAPHLAKYQVLFGYFETQKETQFEQKLPLQPRKQNTVKWIGIAASFVVLFGLATFYFYPSEPKHEDLGTYDNPEEALAATHKALLMVSKQVNVGMESVVYLEEYEKTKKTIFK
ncbi:hypothetical protein FLCU109888_05915 [Flavobacterium cucumis]|uniref:Uncharacterized protein n=1 Tax=Flavobacterium cucumis TaxID=416016 RepID=A0A1M7ZVV0_9FLAO|nr:hypothetical protein [Flavobacterium cucumis]SHO72998.1 hypothetical protein SAMN05443547_1348 [Flavobacterium cucumis]